MVALSLISKRKLKVGVINFDASLREGHGRTAEVTEHPVEAGANISDHIRKLPDTLDIEAVISDHPLFFLASLNADSPISTDVGPVSSRVDAAREELERIMDDGETVDVATTLKTYENMALQSVTFERTMATGNSLAAVMSFKEIVIAQTETIESTPEPETSGNNQPSNLGTQSPPPATPPETSNSSLLLDGISAVFAL